MGRRQAGDNEAQLTFQELTEEPEEEAARPRRSQAKSEPRRSWRERARIVLLWSAVAAGLTLLLAAYYELDRFLASDPRFVLPEMEGGEPNPFFRVEGLVHTPRPHVMQVFAADFRRSIYLLPVRERRRALLELDWVRDAAVSRVWPNSVRVRVIERTPAAFIPLPAAGGALRTALIDDDGVILEPPPRATFTLPVLVGVRPDHPLGARRDRVRRMLRLIDELGALAAQTSEIDVSDPENLRITQQVEGRAVQLIVGNERFRPRLEAFLNHYPEIDRRLPEATVFDLRLDGRITAVEGGRAALESRRRSPVEQRKHGR